MSVDIDQMPDTSFLRESGLVGIKPRKATKTKPARPGTKGILPFSSSTLWRMVVRGEFPAPIKLSERVTAWRVGDVRNWLRVQEGGAR